ncbi:McrC family protein [Undibacterium sp.]|uniref:McrC family protein n=1 Tax=Undibacterium sp. TaxID=1914977 RepID=UPI00374D0C16
MKQAVVVREYAKLTTLQIEPTLDRATISKSAFEWLCRLAGEFRASGAQLLEVEGTQWLRLDNFVGILETPCGTTVEILPKHHDSLSSEALSRALLVRMIQAALNLPTRQVGAADITLFDAPLSEWLRRQFLEALEHLVKRGMKFDYLLVEEEQRHLVGQLDMVRQARQTPDRAHYFHTRHDVFSPDSPENRLIKSALVSVARSTQDPSNWRISHELLQALADVPASRAFAADFKKWRSGRLMAHYAPIFPWCQLVLGQRMPMAVQGEWHGMSMLFPMEKLFEHFVEAALRRDLPKAVQIISQSRKFSLCEHDGEKFFQLRPDLLLKHAGLSIVLDTKWKRLNEKTRDKKYNISQSDFYQLFAYGHKYIEGSQASKELVLVYPKTSTFSTPLAPFAFSSSMTLWVLPFEMGNKAGEEKLILSDLMHLTQALRLAQSN